MDGSHGILNVKKVGTDSTFGIENSFVRVLFDKEKGYFCAEESKTGRRIITDACFQINDEKSCKGTKTFTVKCDSVSHPLGNGLIMSIVGSEERYPDIVLDIILLDNCPFVLFTIGVINSTSEDIKIKYMSVLSGKAFSGYSFSNYKILDGESCYYETKVTSDSSKVSKNNLTALFGDSGNWHTIVLGGLTYYDYEKFARIKKSFDCLDLQLWSEDPVGRLVGPNERYVPDDSFYLDFITANPFKNLESYGIAIRKAQKVLLDSPSYLILNCYYMGVERFGCCEFRNNSLGTVICMDEANRRNIGKYAKVGVRLEPDDYSCPNNQQGWWDDAHFALYSSGSLIKPYDTLEKWGKAIAERNGVCMIYCQSGRRSEDYCIRYPEHMLFNQPYAIRSKGKYGFWNDNKGDIHWGYDYTDPGFIKHLEDVYKNYKDAGVKGIKFDYPDINWCYDGGFEDRKATTAFAHRKMFEIARMGLGLDADIQDRIGMGDLTIGVITTKRTEADTDRMYPTIVSPNGLRWYKNRVVYYIDTDVKNPFHAVPNNLDGVRAMFTMTYVVSGRMELGIPFSAVDKERLHVLTRIFPFHKEPKSARPVDAFCGGKYPEVYDFEVMPGWHQVTFYNTRLDQGEWPRFYRDLLKPLSGNLIPAKISVNMSGDPVRGSLCLNPRKKYHVYDFWNNCYVGLFNGYQKLEQELRPGEARMMSVHEQYPNPQFISTNRHIMQGYVDMCTYPVWDAERKVLTGSSIVVGGETYKIIIAPNGYVPISCSTREETGKIYFNIREIDRLVEFFFEFEESIEVNWVMEFTYGSTM